MIAEQISEMQTEVISLREQNKLLEVDVAVLSQENQQLRTELIRARAEAQTWMLKCTEVQTLVESTSLALVHGLNRIRETKRAVQEEQLGVDNRTSPLVLREQRSPPEEDPTLGRRGGGTVRDLRLPSARL